MLRPMYEARRKIKAIQKSLLEKVQSNKLNEIEKANLVINQKKTSNQFIYKSDVAKAVDAVVNSPDSLLPVELRDRSKQIADIIYKAVSASLKPLKCYETVRVSTTPVQQPVTMLKLPKQLFCNIKEYKNEYDQMLADAKTMNIRYLEEGYEDTNHTSVDDDYNETYASRY